MASDTVNVEQEAGFLYSDGLLTSWVRRFAGAVSRKLNHGGGLHALEERLGYKFRDRDLLLTALTHPSLKDNGCGSNGDSDNQRLEFLGDAVLGFLVAAHLYRKHQGHREGVLTCLRSRVTNGRMLSRIAAEIGLGDFILMAPSEERMGGRQRSAALADTLESIFGAAYLDGGMPAVELIFRQLFGCSLDKASSDIWADNPKGKLQCLTQRWLREDPRYRLRSKDGTPHEPVFTVEVMVQGEVVGCGTGVNKRKAQCEAARMALDKLSGSKIPHRFYV